MNDQAVMNPDYLLLHCGGKHLDNWLQNVDMNRNEKNVLAWKLCHVCISFFHREYIGKDTELVFGDVVDELVMLFKCVKRDLFENDCVDEMLCLWLYFAMGSSYGQANQNTSFSDELWRVIDVLQNLDINQPTFPVFRFEDTEHTFPRRPSIV